MESLCEYYRTQLARYREFLERSLHRPSEENIHELRVTIKRLKALHQLAKFAKPSFRSKKQFRAFKEVFDLFGGIRDLDITMSLVERPRDELTVARTSLVDYLRTERERRHAEIRSAIEVNGWYRTEDVALSNVLRALDKERATSFLKEVRNEISALSTRDATINELHAARKLFKTYLYVLEAIGSSGKTSAKELSLVQSMQRTLGDWHDLVIAIQTLHSLEHEPSLRVRPGDIELILKGLTDAERRSRKHILDDQVGSDC